MVNTINLTCPGCGSRISFDAKKCEFCHAPIVITSFNSVNEMDSLTLNKYVNEYKNIIQNNSENVDANLSMAMCYLKLKLYDKAIPCFEKVIDNNINNAEAYFYYAVSLLKGKKAFLTTREIIDKIMEYVDAAIMIEPRGIFYYFLAYIKLDYFHRKSYLIEPNYIETIEIAKNVGLSEYDVNLLFEILHIEKPSLMK